MGLTCAPVAAHHTPQPPKPATGAAALPSVFRLAQVHRKPVTNIASMHVPVILHTLVRHFSLLRRGAHRQVLRRRHSSTIWPRFAMPVMACLAASIVHTLPTAQVLKEGGGEGGGWGEVMAEGICSFPPCINGAVAIGPGLSAAGPRATVSPRRQLGPRGCTMEALSAGA